MVFSADPAFWTDRYADRVRAKMSNNDGRFSFDGLPPGEYFALAFDDVSFREIMSPSLLTLARLKATHFVLREGGQESLSLRVQSIAH